MASSEIQNNFDQIVYALERFDHFRKSHLTTWLYEPSEVDTGEAYREYLQQIDRHLAFAPAQVLHVTCPGSLDWTRNHQYFCGKAYKSALSLAQDSYHIDPMMLAKLNRNLVSMLEHQLATNSLNRYQILNTYSNVRLNAYANTRYAFLTSLLDMRMGYLDEVLQHFNPWKPVTIIESFTTHENEVNNLILAHKNVKVRSHVINLHDTEASSLCADLDMDAKIGLPAFWRPSLDTPTIAIVHNNDRAVPASVLTRDNQAQAVNLSEINTIFENLRQTNQAQAIWLASSTAIADNERIAATGLPLVCWDFPDMYDRQPALNAEYSRLVISTPEKWRAFRKKHTGTPLGEAWLARWDTVKAGKIGTYVCDPRNDWRFQVKQLLQFWQLKVEGTSSFIDQYSPADLARKLIKKAALFNTQGAIHFYDPLLTAKDWTVIDAPVTFHERGQLRTVHPVDYRAKISHDCGTYMTHDVISKVYVILGTLESALIRPGVPSPVLCTLLDNLINMATYDSVSKFYDSYNEILGGEVSEDSIKNSKFGPYYGTLNITQQLNLRTFINKGTVKIDVLDNQPMTVWLLLANNVSLNRIKNKKAALLDSLSMNETLPKWLLNRIVENLTTEELKTKSSIVSALNDRKRFFQLCKMSWNSTNSMLWILHKEPKLFAELPMAQLHNFIAYCNEIEAPSSLKYTSNYWPYGAKPDTNVPNPYLCGADTMSGHLYKLYQDWTANKQNTNQDYEWKNFCLEFRKFLGVFLPDTVPYTSFRIQKPETVEVNHFVNNRLLVLNRAVNSDLWGHIAFLYGILTRETPYDSWENFSAFITQINYWIAQAKNWHEARRNERNNLQAGRFNWDFRPILDTEEYVLYLISESGHWYAANDRDGNRRIALNLENQIVRDAEGYDPIAYRAVAALWGTFIFKAVYVPRTTVLDRKQLEENTYEVLPAMSGVHTMKGLDVPYRVTQLTNELQLRDEGSQMHHCVGGYHDRCINKTSVIFHMEPVDNNDTKSTRVSTLELLPSSSYDRNSILLKVGQHYSIRNCTPHEDNRALGIWLAKTWTDCYNSSEYKMFVYLIKFLESLGSLHGGNTKEVSITEALEKSKTVLQSRLSTEVNLEMHSDQAVKAGSDIVPDVDENVDVPIQF